LILFIYSFYPIYSIYPILTYPILSIYLSISISIYIYLYLSISSDDPPLPVLQAFGKDVLINLVKDKQQPEKPAAIIAPRRAQVHLRTHKSTTDPCLHPQQDPWSKFKAPEPAAQPPKRYDALASQIQASLQEQFNGATASADPALEQRMQRWKLVWLSFKLTMPKLVFG
jgi:hypothetical protein